MEIPPRRPDDPAQARATSDFSLAARGCSPQATWKEHRRFQAAARALVRFPVPGADPLESLWDETQWTAFVPPDEHEETVATALSQATGVYFFPSRQWVQAFCQWLARQDFRRVLEAGAGRGYLAAVLAPLLSAQGIAFQAVDLALGEFETGLPRHPQVATADALSAVQAFRPDLVVYAWPPPGQSVGPLCRQPSVRAVLVLGEAGGGCTGDPADWQILPCRELPLLSSLGLGRSGRRRQAATLFLGVAASGREELF